MDVSPVIGGFLGQGLPTGGFVSNSGSSGSFFSSPVLGGLLGQGLPIGGFIEGTGSSTGTFSLSPTQVNKGTSGNIIAVIGAGNSWLTSLPTFTASDGIILTSITGNNLASLTYTAPNIVENVTITDPSSGFTQTLSIVSPGSNLVSVPLYSQSSQLINMSASVVYHIITAQTGLLYVIQNVGSSLVYLGGPSVSSTLGIAIATGNTFPDVANEITSEISGIPVDWYAVASSSASIVVTKYIKNVYSSFFTQG